MCSPDPSSSTGPEPPVNSQIRYRLATVKDAPRVIAMINAAFSIEEFLEGTRTDDVRFAAMMEKGSILIAEDEASDLLGSVYFELRGKRGYLGMLAVDPAQQGRGLARRLVEAAENHLRAAGCDEVEIIVLNMRPELVPIYQRFGFVVEGTTRFTPSRTLKPGVECYGIIMVKKLVSCRSSNTFS
jgi:ribosomal protein S18 acetylase RimI-like enzyme